jgi:glycosyltransferase involved in cell wall biosynthesis
MGIPFEIIDTLNSDEALALIKREKLMAVMPSLAETFGLVLYECILNHIPFLCSDIPTFREMVHPDGIFGTTAKALSAKLAEVQVRDLAALRHRIDPKSANESWISCLNMTLEAAARKTPRSKPTDNPLVSICVPYYNYGKYLPGLIRSLENSSYKNIEVIVVNDGSTDPFSNRVFEDSRKKLESKPNWLFINKENGGIGQTRNVAARRATGDYVIFMDADNEAKPHMIETFTRCMQASGMDCLACFLDCFNHAIEEPDDRTPLEWIYAPIGNAPEISLFENTFGDANFIVKRDVFLKIGGFKEDRTTSFEDYDFLAHLSLSGGTLDVIPEGLLWYRVTTEGFSRNTSIVRNHRRVLRTYIEAPDRFDFRFLVEQILMPMYYHYVIYRGHKPASTRMPAPPGSALPPLPSLHPTLYGLALMAQGFLGRSAPQGSRRRKMLRWVAQWFRNRTAVNSPAR